LPPARVIPARCGSVARLTQGALSVIEIRDHASAPDDRPARAPLPVGYRQGVISAITVLMGFSLLFLRYWSFEAPGVWSAASIAAAVLLVVAIALQFVALWRSLQLEDDEAHEYRKTLRWFLASVFGLMISMLLAEISSMHLFNL
jgi:hypothetical protein